MSPSRCVVHDDDVLLLWIRQVTRPLAVGACVGDISGVEPKVPQTARSKAVHSALAQVCIACNYLRLHTFKDLLQERDEVPAAMAWQWLLSAVNGIFTSLGTYACICTGEISHCW